MAPGFIHDELDIKMLILYIMSRAAGPLDFATLTDLALCDSGVDYFLFAQAVSDLVESGHLLLADGLYSATEKGRLNSATLESTLPYVVRAKCDKALLTLNDSIRRAAQVTADVSEEQGRCAVHLALSDDAGLLLDLTLSIPTAQQAQRVAQRFRESPEAAYTQLVRLLDEPKEER